MTDSPPLSTDEHPSRHGASQASGTPANKPYRQCAPDKTRLRLDLSYDGGDFHGWQRQTNLANTVQGTIERAVAQIYKRHLTPEAPLIPVIGASRTDTGVHAEMQVAHFDAPVEPSEAWDLRYALQCLLPESLVITKLLLAPRDFHAIACTSSKTYRFQILNQKVPSALLRHRVWWIRHPLRIENLNAMARLVVGQHDFAAFQTSGSPVPSTTRTIFAAQWDEVGDEILAFSVSGSGFLKQMVRNLVGTMVDLDRSGAGPDEFAKVLASRDRRQAGVTAEPQGLYLQRVDYPPEIDNRCVHLY